MQPDLPVKGLAVVPEFVMIHSHWTQGSPHLCCRILSFAAGDIHFRGWYSIGAPVRAKVNSKNDRQLGEICELHFRISIKTAGTETEAAGVEHRPGESIS